MYGSEGVAINQGEKLTVLKSTRVTRACLEREIDEDSTACLKVGSGKCVAFNQKENTYSIKIDESTGLLGTGDR